MKILFLYPNAEGYSRVPLGTSLIMSVLSEDGHEVEVFDSTFILRNEHTDNMTREKAKLVFPTDISHLYNPCSPESVDEMIREKAKTFLPDLVAVSIVEDNYALADHFLDVIKSVNKDVPVIVGGSTPTVVPDVVIENPKIDYLIQGEGEEAMREFCGLMEKGEYVENVKNLWSKKNGKIKSNPLRPFLDMDTLPIQNLDFWNVNHFVKPYSGKLYQSGYFEMSRGCLNKCTYCINDTYQAKMQSAGKYHRRKSVHKTIKEIKTLKEKFKFEMIFFCDDNFLLMSQERMDEFAGSWKTEVNIPYWINTTVETITRDKLSKLKDTGCCGIGIGLESGSEWLRKNVLRRKVSNKNIAKAFKMVHEFDIRTTANNMIGFPGEYEADIFETIKLVRDVKPKSCDLTFVAPYIATIIYTVSKKFGYLDVWEKPGFRGMAKDVSIRRGPVIKTPHISHEKLIKIFYEFMDYAEGRLPIPEKFLGSAPGCDGSAIPRGDMGLEIAETINMLCSK